MAKLTPWYPMATKPVRFGEYEGREKRTGQRLVVFWRKLTDEKEPGWYFHNGQLGPFNLWEAAESRMTGWRGLAHPTTSQQNKPLKRCAAGRDGECGHKDCPQLRDAEPGKSGRHCPLDTQQEDRPCAKN